jgi:hypothetical protein
MSPPRHAFAAAVLALAASACGRSKVDQCNAFIDRANAAQNTINALKLDSDDPKKLEADAAKIDAEAKAVKAVDVKDEKLVKFRDDYAANLTKLSSNVKDLAKLQADAKNPAKAATIEAQAKKLETDADTIEKDESKLVGDINQYCTGSK